MKVFLIRFCFALLCVSVLSCGGDGSANKMDHSQHTKESKSNPSAEESIKAPDFKTRKMIKRLAEAVAKIDPDKVSDYLSSNTISVLDKKIQSSNGVQKIELLSHKATALLNVGQTKESIKIFESLINQLKGNASSNQFIYSMKKQLAIG